MKRPTPPKAANGSGSYPKWYPSLDRLVGKHPCPARGKPIVKYGRPGVGRKPGTEREAEAKAVWATVLAELEKYGGIPQGVDASSTVLAYIDEYCAKGSPKHRERNKSAIYETKRDGKNVVVRLRPFIERLAHMRMVDVQRLDLQQAINGVAPEDPKNKRGHTMNRTRELVYKILKAVVRRAMRDGLISKDPSAGMDKPEYIVSDAARVYTKREQAFIVAAEAARGGRYSTMLALALSMPMRPCELFAIRRSKVSLTNRRVRIDTDLTRPKEANYRAVFAPTKTKQVRDVVLTADTTPAISQHLQAMLKAGRAAPDSLLFTMPDGGPVDHTNLSDRWWHTLLDATAEAAETDARARGDVDYRFPRIGLNGLRHTAIENLKAAGVPVDVAAKLAGHSVATMLKYYNRPTPERLDEAGAMLDAWRKTGAVGMR